MDNHGAGDQVSVSVNDYEGSPNDSDGDSSPSFSCPKLLRDFVVDGRLPLDQIDQTESGMVKKLSQDIVTLYGEGTHVVDVNQILYSGGSIVAQVRLECFLSFRKGVEARRGGDANVQYGWYGGSWAEICAVLRYGFFRCGDFNKRFSHGVGVYLSPVNFTIDSLVRAKEDENGIRHMLLCRIILGKTETIPAGSEQAYPSSTDFDSGIDNPLVPRNYIIWSGYMNSHILPILVFSFKTPPYLTECVMCVCSMPYQQEDKIDRSELIRRFRSFAGDDVIIFGSKIV